MKVMNVKFVGRIIMTILFVFICIGAYAGDDLLKYEIEGEGVGVQGTYLVKVTVIQKKSKLDIDVIKKCAVHGVLFKGFSSQTSRTRQKPLNKTSLTAFFFACSIASKKNAVRDVLFKGFCRVREV